MATPVRSEFTREFSNSNSSGKQVSQSTPQGIGSSASSISSSSSGHPWSSASSSDRRAYSEEWGQYAATMYRVAQNIKDDN